MPVAAKQGRGINFVPWKIRVLYLVGFIPAIWAFYLGSTGGLGADPVKSFEHMLGIWALRFLILTLAVSPLRSLTGISLLRYRRALGLLAFYYVLMHFLAYMVLDQALNFPEIVKDITQRPFISIGMICFILLIPLALTSNNWSIRKLGKRWIKLHKLVYIVIAGGAVHYIMSVKSWPMEPMIYGLIVAILLLWRPLHQMTNQYRTKR